MEQSSTPTQADPPSLQRLSELPPTGAPIAELPPPPHSGVTFYGLATLVCLLSTGLGLFGAVWIVLFYQLPRILNYRPSTLPGLDTVGSIAGGTGGMLVGILWTRRWATRRAKGKMLTLGLAMAWGAELGITASIFIHLFVGPANFLIDSQSTRWGEVLGAILLLGLPFGALGGALLGLISGLVAKGAEQ